MKEAINISNIKRDRIDELIPKANNIRDRLFSKEMHILNSILDKGVNNGEFYISNVMLTAQAIGYALRGFEATWLQDENNAEIEKHLDNLFDILCKGILVREKTT
jgi:hypothetical protein